MNLSQLCEEGTPRWILCCSGMEGRICQKHSHDTFVGAFEMGQLNCANKLVFTRKKSIFAILSLAYTARNTFYWRNLK